jgi:hypothetical protein
VNWWHCYLDYNDPLILQRMVTISVPASVLRMTGAVDDTEERDDRGLVGGDLGNGEVTQIARALKIEQTPLGKADRPAANFGLYA